MEKRRIYITFIFSCLFSSVTYAGWLGGPSDYDECILESMKGVTSDVAAKMIRQSCQKKFPKKTPEDNSVELPSSVIEKIKGNAKMTGGYYEGTIFNGDNEWHITSLTVRIVDNKTKQYRDYKTRVGQVLEVYSPIPPLTSGEFNFKPFEIPADRSWYILDGRGYKE